MKKRLFFFMALLAIVLLAACRITSYNVCYTKLLRYEMEIDDLASLMVEAEYSYKNISIILYDEFNFSIENRNNFVQHTLYEVIRDVWLLLSTYIPIPIFYDDISFKYSGIEGMRIESGLKLPKPGLNIIDFDKIGTFVSQLGKFFSDKDFV